MSSWSSGYVIRVSRFESWLRQTFFSFFSLFFTWKCFSYVCKNGRFIWKCYKYDYFCIMSHFWILICLLYYSLPTVHYCGVIKVGEKKWNEKKNEKKPKKVIEALARLEPANYRLQVRHANHYTTRNITIYV